LARGCCADGDADRARRDQTGGACRLHL
jgi:hypothetical protein